MLTKSKKTIVFHLDYIRTKEQPYGRKPSRRDSEFGVFLTFVFMFGDKEMKGFTVAVINMLVPSM